MSTLRERFSYDKLRKYFSFFEFYYYVIKRSPKRYNLSHGTSMDYFSILITPFILWIISMVVFLFVGYGWAMVLFLALGAGFVLNLIFTRSVLSEGYEIQRRLDEERREMEREERHKILEEERKRAEQYRQEERRRAEQHRKKSEINQVNQLYAVLGIKPTTNFNVIRRAYRQKAKELHPDIKGGDDSAFKELQDAHDIILKLIDSKN